MAIKALEGLTPFWYTPIDEREEDTPTRFRLKPLNSEELDVAMEGAIKQGDVLKLSAAGIKAAMRAGLVDWEHFADSSGPVKCVFHNFHRLPWPVRQELAGEIVNASFLGEDAEKN